MIYNENIKLERGYIVKYIDTFTGIVDTKKIKKFSLHGVIIVYSSSRLPTFIAKQNIIEYYTLEKNPEMFL